MHYYKLLLPLILLGLAGCRADLSQCPDVDLARVGREEALSGVAAALPKPGCAPTGADLAAYERGRAEGLQRYCSAARGYALGMDGKAINADLCSAEAAKELHRGFEVGKELRHHLGERDRLNAQASETDRVAATLPEGSPERRKIEDQAAGLRFDARQRENDVEALRGIVAVEKWQ